jgi:hypothetical protein
MAEAQRILGQAAPAAGVLTDLYTAPSRAVVSSVTACNRSSTADTRFRLSVASGGAVDSPDQYVYYDLPLFAADTFIATVGITLAAGDVVRCYADSASVSFNLFGVEIT